MEWNGMSAILLTEYFEDKQRLSEKKTKLNHLNNFVTTDYRDDLSEMKSKLEREMKRKLENEVKEIEQKIVEFISALDPQHLKSIIYMSLDMDVEVGFSDKLAQ